MIKKYKHKITELIVTGVQWDTKNLKQIKQIFDGSKIQYIYNELFVDDILVEPFDYCIIDQLYDIDIVSQKRFKLLYKQYQIVPLKNVISCGGIIKCQNKILIVHSTNNKYWNFPKGQLQGDQTPHIAAIRQIKQQTNINVNGCIYKDLGEHNYITNKRIHLFLFILNELPTDIKCMSTFLDEKTNKIWPEIDNFKWCDIEESLTYLGPSITKVFKQILKKYPQINYPQVRYVTP